MGLQNNKQIYYQMKIYWSSHFNKNICIRCFDWEKEANIGQIEKVYIKNNHDFKRIFLKRFKNLRRWDQDVFLMKKRKQRNNEYINTGEEVSRFILIICLFVDIVEHHIEEELREEVIVYGDIFNKRMDKGKRIKYPYSITIKENDVNEIIAQEK